MIIPTKARPEIVSSKEPGRYQIDRPWFKDGHIFATDGRIAVRIPVHGHEKDQEGFIRIDALNLMRRAKRNEHKLIKLKGAVEIPHAKATLEDNQDERASMASVLSQLEDNPYPAVNPLIKDAQENKLKLRINARHLLRLAQSMGTDCVELLMSEKSENPILVKPMKIEYRDDPVVGAVGLIMPISSDY